MTAEDLAVEILGDAEICREMAQLAITALHDLTVEHDQLRDRYHRLLDEHRALRQPKAVAA